jgi:hypothetical protein
MNRTSRRYRLEVTELESRLTPSGVIASFASGLWEYYDATVSSAGHWYQMRTEKPSQFVADSAGDVAAVFSSGLWCYNAASSQWVQLTSLQPTQLVVGGSGGSTNVAGLFSPIGVWECIGTRATAGTWQQLTAAVPTQLAMADLGGSVAGAFSFGLWDYYNPGNTTGRSGWYQLTNYAPSQIALNQTGGTVAASFPTIGLWRYGVTSGWQQLSAAIPGSFQMDTSGATIAAVFSDGLWTDDDAGAHHATTAVPSVYTEQASLFAGVFASGTWQYQTYTGTWTRIDTQTASQLGSDPYGRLAKVDSTGLSEYVDGAWTVLTTAVPTAIVDV